MNMKKAGVGTICFVGGAMKQRAACLCMVIGGGLVAVAADGGHSLTCAGSEADAQRTIMDGWCR